MANKDFNDIHKMFAHLIRQAEATLNNEVAEVVRDVQQEKIDEEVYDVYNIYDQEHHEPFVHERRRDNDGLRSRKNMIANTKETSDGVELSVTNIAKGDQQEDLFIAPLVEYGDNAGYGEYTYKYNRTGTAYQYLNPRPFTAETIKSLKSTGKHIQALKRGLTKRGLKIE